MEIDLGKIWTSFRASWKKNWLDWAIVFALFFIFLWAGAEIIGSLLGKIKNIYMVDFCGVLNAVSIVSLWNSIKRKRRVDAIADRARERMAEDLQTRLQQRINRLGVNARVEATVRPAPDRVEQEREEPRNRPANPRTDREGVKKLAKTVSADITKAFVFMFLNLFVNVGILYEIYRIFLQKVIPGLGFWSIGALYAFAVILRKPVTLVPRLKSGYVKYYVEEKKSTERAERAERAERVGGGMME